MAFAPRLRMFKLKPIHWLGRARPAVARWVGASILSVIVLSGCSTAPAPQQQPPPRNLNLEVRDEFARSLAGWNAGSLEGFMSIYDRDATFALRDSFLQGYAAIRAYYAPQFLPGVERGMLSLPELNVEVLALDIVLVRAIYENTQRGQVTARGTSTLVLRHSNGHWRVIHDHST